MTGAIAVAAVMIVVFPPWQARAIRTTMRYAAVSGVAPSVLTDTLTWTLPFAPVYAPPRVPLDGQGMRRLALRALSGDTAAAAELRRTTGPTERAYHAPDVLSAGGALWRDSVLAKARIPSVTSYDLSFATDRRWMSARLVVLLLAGFLLLRWPAGPLSRIPGGNPRGPNLSARTD